MIDAQIIPINKNMNNSMGIALRGDKYDHTPLQNVGKKNNICTHIYTYICEKSIQLSSRGIRDYYIHLSFIIITFFVPS